MSEFTAPGWRGIYQRPGIRRVCGARLVPHIGGSLGASRCRPEVSKMSAPPVLEGGEFATSTTISARKGPCRTPSPVIVLTPVLGAAGIHLVALLTGVCRHLVR